MFPQILWDKMKKGANRNVNTYVAPCNRTLTFLIYAHKMGASVSLCHCYFHFSTSAVAVTIHFLNNREATAF